MLKLNCDKIHEVIFLDKVRLSAVKIIYAVTEKGAYANIELAKTLRQEKFSDLDRRFCTELVYGTIKTAVTLDWKLQKYLSRPLEKVDAKVLTVLRLGMYQIFFMDKVPESAAVNESVEIAKKFSGIGASKFVNGVLRNVLRSPDKSKIPEDESVESIALKTFHPTWLVKLFVEEFGIETAKKICAADNVEPPLCLRVNFLKTSREKVLTELKNLGLEVEESKIAAEGIICRSHGALDRLKILKVGLCQVQDESSMFAAHFLNPAENDFVIDCCAAPGGKSTHIAELMKNRGKIIACDIHEHKIEHIKQNAKRLGVKIIEPVLLDARKIGEKYFEQADKILIDAPCSGLGVIRRKADLRLKKNSADLEKLPQLQFEILSSAAKALTSGGVLVYSTCTILKRENEDVVNKFLAENKNFALIETKNFITHIDGTDGFFCAKLTKKF